MSWDAPSQSKWFFGAATVVLVAGLTVMSRDGTPVLAASAAAPRTAAMAESDVRDAVASPGVVPGGVGWLQAAKGMAALSGAPRDPRLIDRLLARKASRPAAGRTVFSQKRAIVDKVKSEAPKPTL